MEKHSAFFDAGCCLAFTFIRLVATFWKPALYIADAYLSGYHCARYIYMLYRSHDTTPCSLEPKKLRILGTRGIPASHGGFETFAQHLAAHLVKKGWSVAVYCQTENGEPIIEELWNGVRLIKISESRPDAFGTMRFDWNCIQHAAKSRELVLTLGYNTAIFSFLLRMRRVPHVMNMDGIEWKRSKWGLLARLWFYLNEWAGTFIPNHLIYNLLELF